MVEYYYSTTCIFRWWDIISGIFPEYVCTDYYINYIIEPLKTINLFNPTVEMGVGILFLFAVGILGVTITELLANKLDWYLTPLVNRVVKRYRYTIQRNRLNTMNGHP